MRLILTMNIPYYGDARYNNGAVIAHRKLMEELAASQHGVQVVTPLVGDASRGTRDELLSYLADQGIDFTSQSGKITFSVNRVEVHAATDHGPGKHLQQLIRESAPDWILVSCEDWSQGLLDIALASGTPVAYLVLSPTYLPFGPQAFRPSPGVTRQLEQASLIIAGNRFIQEYIHAHSDLQAEVYRWPAYGSGPFPRFGGFGDGFVTMLNPCAVKGLAIFLALAQALPEARFAVVPTWGTTTDDLAGLRQLANVSVLEAVENVDLIYRQTSILVMPSLWVEGVGLAAMEAMLRGIPVLASPSGALPETTLGAHGLLPVEPIEAYTGSLDERQIPVPIVPQQHPEPWIAAVSRLLKDPEHYEAQSAAAREAANDHVATLSAAAFGELLGQARPLAGSPGGGRAAAAVNQLDLVAELSLEQRSLLMKWLQQRPENVASGGAGR